MGKALKWTFPSVCGRKTISFSHNYKPISVKSKFIVHLAAQSFHYIILFIALQLVVHVGLSGRAKAVTLEQCAHNTGYSKLVYVQYNLILRRYLSPVLFILNFFSAQYYFAKQFFCLSNIFKYYLINALNNMRISNLFCLNILSIRITDTFKKQC